MADGDEPTPVGAIFDANSSGRFDLVIYEDGLLGVKGTYAGVALRGAGAGMGTSDVGWSAGSSYEAKKLAEQLECGRDSLMNNEPNFFIPRASILGLTLRKRWHGHSLTVRTSDDAAQRTSDWKPRLNNFEHVDDQLRSAFQDLVHRK